MADNFADDRSGSGEQLVLSHVRFQVDLRGIRATPGAGDEQKLSEIADEAKEGRIVVVKYELWPGTGYSHRMCAQAVQLNY